MPTVHPDTPAYQLVDEHGLTSPSGFPECGPCRVSAGWTMLDDHGPAACQNVRVAERLDLDVVHDR